MRRLALFAFVLAAACSPIQDIKDECILAAEDAKLECTRFFEDEVIPDLENRANGIIEDLQTWIEELIQMEKDNLLNDFGCKRYEFPAHWDCSETTLCPG